MSISIRRTGIVLRPNKGRVLFRPFILGDKSRILKLVSRVTSMTPDDASRMLTQVLSEFGGRHQQLNNFFLRRFAEVREYLLTDEPLSEDQRLLIGSYFTQEYALESAALFNPSMIWSPDQSNVPAGNRRFIISLRATGEGHISSLCFRSGLVDLEGNIDLDPTSGFVTSPRIVPDNSYERVLFQRKLAELGYTGGFVSAIMSVLDDTFTLTELETAIALSLQKNASRQPDWPAIGRIAINLAKANYEIECDPKTPVSEHVIFPHSPTESNGIEDARFVHFVDGDESCYYATYTAYDGHTTFPQLLSTTDFTRFKISTLNGPEVANKGMALFPRKIDGQYVMLSRQDGENLFLMYSDMLHFWYTKRLIIKPTYPWEYVQIGNCGSPIETEAGWLVLSHGVGPMRKYSIGAYLLDLHDPSKVIGRLAEPLLAPDENEREGYVPNVVYSCGAMIHGENLIIPYAMADYASTFATVKVDELLSKLIGN